MYNRCAPSILGGSSVKEPPCRKRWYLYKRMLPYPLRSKSLWGFERKIKWWYLSSFGHTNPSRGNGRRGLCPKCPARNVERKEICCTARSVLTIAQNVDTPPW